MKNSPFSRFSSEMQVRPDDIDMNQHVHNSRYFDYVLAARYDQMEHHYRFPMEEFIQNNYGWVVQKAEVEYKRPLGLGEWFIVETGIDEIQLKGCIVSFSIVSKKTNKVCCEGKFHYTMINTQTGRAEVVPEWIRIRYSI
jgi:YbgC/YbaW family acyl-CoA thioester hydrolase